MKNRTRHVGKMEIIKRLPQSLNGNARFLIRVDGWTCCTPVDSCLADYVKNYDGKIVEAIIGTHYRSATLDEIQLAKV
jgi:hypothetical protein